MNQVSRMKVFSILLLMAIGTSLMAGCISAPAQNTTPTPSPTLQGTASTTPAPTPQGNLSAEQPRISVPTFRYTVPRGEDVLFKGNVSGDFKFLTITTYYVCTLDASECPSPKSLYNTTNFIDKKVVSVNADFSFSQNMSTSAFNEGLHVAFLELPTGKYSTLVFKVVSKESA